MNRDGMGGPRGADPRSNSIAVHFANSRGGIRVSTVRMVVALCEGGRRDDGCVEITGLPGHEGEFIAELAIARLVERIRGDFTASVVHAHDHHRGNVSAGVRRVHREGRVIQAVVDSILVGIHPGYFVSGPVFDRYRQVRR